MRWKRDIITERSAQNYRRWWLQDLLLSLGLLCNDRHQKMLFKSSVLKRFSVVPVFQERSDFVVRVTAAYFVPCSTFKEPQSSWLLKCTRSTMMSQWMCTPLGCACWRWPPQSTPTLSARTLHKSTAKLLV